MKITKKFGSRIGAENWRDYCSRHYPDKKIDLFRDLTKVSTYYVGIIEKTNPLEYVLECGTEFQRNKIIKLI